MSVSWISTSFVQLCKAYCTSLWDGVCVCVCVYHRDQSWVPAPALLRGPLQEDCSHQNHRDPRRRGSNTHTHTHTHTHTRKYSSQLQRSKDKQIKRIISIIPISFQCSGPGFYVDWHTPPAKTLGRWCGPRNVTKSSRCQPDQIWLSIQEQGNGQGMSVS